MKSPNEPFYMLSAIVLDDTGPNMANSIGMCFRGGFILGAGIECQLPAANPLARSPLSKQGTWTCWMIQDLEDLLTALLEDDDKKEDSYGSDSGSADSADSNFLQIYLVALQPFYDSYEKSRQEKRAQEKKE